MAQRRCKIAEIARPVADSVSHRGKILIQRLYFDSSRRRHVRHLTGTLPGTSRDMPGRDTQRLYRLGYCTVEQ